MRCVLRCVGIVVMKGPGMRRLRVLRLALVRMVERVLMLLERLLAR